MGEETIGSSLRARRMDLGLDQRDAGARIGMSRTTYSSYERDTQRPSVDVFPALAQFLDISTEELLTLYGATCVMSVRPSLERLLLAKDSTHVVEEDSTPDVPRGLPQEPLRGTPEYSPNGASSSIFANELSDVDAAYEPTTVSVRRDPEIRPSDKAMKTKKKKKGKNKRGKAVEVVISNCYG
jgi:transcriptional regulator with XRE-family HTH domain